MVKTASLQPVADIKPKLMKTVHAANLVDKNSRTISKILQLLVITHIILLMKYDNEP